MPPPAPVPSLMDNLEFIAELDTMDRVPDSGPSPSSTLDLVHAMDDGLEPQQSRLHAVAPEPSGYHGERQGSRDRNAIHPAPIEPDEADDETSVTVSARAAAFAVMGSALFGVGAAVLVFHERLALLLR